MEANPKIENWNCSIGVSVCVCSFHNENVENASEANFSSSLHTTFSTIGNSLMEQPFKLLIVPKQNELTWVAFILHIFVEIMITFVHSSFANDSCVRLIDERFPWRSKEHVDHRWAQSCSANSFVFSSELPIFFVHAVDWHSDVNNIPCCCDRSTMQRCGHMQVNGTKLVLDLEISKWLQVFPVNMYNVQVHRTDSTHRHIRIVPIFAARSFVEWLWRENLCKPIIMVLASHILVASLICILCIFHRWNRNGWRRVEHAHWQSESKQIKVLLTE